MIPTATGPTAALLLLLIVVVALPSGSMAQWFAPKRGFNCEESADHECMAGGLFNLGGFLSGRYMCREQRSWFFFQRNETVCVPTVAGGAIGNVGDRCGCCDGDCPAKCTCRCNNDRDFHVLVYKDKLLGKNGVECVSQGKASRWTAAEDEGYSCVPENECHLYTMEPTVAPTGEPTYEPTKHPTFPPFEALETSEPTFEPTSQWEEERAQEQQTGWAMGPDVP